MSTCCAIAAARRHPRGEARSPGCSGLFQPPASPGGSTTVDDAYRHRNPPPGGARGYQSRDDASSNALASTTLSPRLSRQTAAATCLATFQPHIPQQLTLPVAKNEFRDTSPPATKPALHPPHLLSQNATAPMSAKNYWQSWQTRQTWQRRQTRKIPKFFQQSTPPHHLQFQKPTPPNRTMMTPTTPQRPFSPARSRRVGSQSRATAHG